jgi:hypothetical protein
LAFRLYMLSVNTLCCSKLRNLLTMTSSASQDCGAAVLVRARVRQVSSTRPSMPHHKLRPAFGNLLYIKARVIPLGKPESHITTGMRCLFDGMVQIGSCFNNTLSDEVLLGLNMEYK